MVSLGTIVLGLLLFAIYYYFFRNKGRRAPGPRGFPIIGNLFAVGPSPHLTFHEWAKKYGPVVQARLGTMSVLILDDVKVIREAFNNPVLSGRPNVESFQLLSDGKHGIMNSEGQTWVDQRRFTLRNLRDFGFGKQSMESLIHEEVLDLLSWMKKNDGIPVSVNKKFTLTVLNAFWTIMAGHRYEQDDTKQTTMIQKLDDVFRDELVKRGYLMFFPELARLAKKFPNLSGWSEMVKAKIPFKQIFADAVAEHEENPGDPNHPRDFIDAYMNEISKTSDPNSSFYGEAGRHSMITVLGDLYGAGSGTTSASLVFAILYLMMHPNIQKKLQEEIDTVIGKTRHPSLADRPNTPFMEATLQEIFRFSTLAPTAIFHNAMEDTTFQGYDIKKDTVVIGNLYSVHFNNKIWGDPENFRPERFINPDGKLIRNSEAFMPFGTGKRQCLGETLARDQLYLFITSIFQRFNALQDTTNPEPSLEPKVGLFREAQPFTVVFKERE